MKLFVFKKNLVFFKLWPNATYFLIALRNKKTISGSGVIFWEEICTAIARLVIGMHEDLYSKFDNSSYTPGNSRKTTTGKRGRAWWTSLVCHFNSRQPCVRARRSSWNTRLDVENEITIVVVCGKIRATGEQVSVRGSVTTNNDKCLPDTLFTVMTIAIIDLW